MKKFIKVIFFIFNILIVYAQRNQDTVISKKTKWSIAISGGINMASLKNPNGLGYSYISSKNQTGIFCGIQGAYSIQPNIKISFGAGYYQFSYYIATFGFNYTIYDFKMILFPIYFTIKSNEYKKFNLILSFGPEIGSVLSLTGSDKFQNNNYRTYNLGWSGIPVFITGDANIYYTISNHFLIGTTIGASMQINPFTENAYILLKHYILYTKFGISIKFKIFKS